jgi:hypothetical protein
MIRYISTIIILAQFAAMAQFTPVKEDLYSGLVKRIVVLPNGCYLSRTQAISPWKNWVLECTLYMSHGEPDSAAFVMFPASDTTMAFTLLRVHGIHKDIFTANIRPDWGVYHPIWDLCQEKICIYVAGTEINTTYNPTELVPGEFFTIDVSSLTRVIIHDIEYTSLPRTSVSPLSKQFALKKLTTINYPNPFNRSTNIEYSLPKNDKVSILIYGINGDLIKAITYPEKQVGNYTEVWNGRNNLGREMANGEYFYQVISGDYISTKKMILLK